MSVCMFGFNFRLIIAAWQYYLTSLSRMVLTHNLITRGQEAKLSKISNKKQIV